MNLKLLNAQYKTNINNITDEIAHHITLENFEQHLNIAASSQNEYDGINVVQEDVQDELSR